VTVSDGFLVVWSSPSWTPGDAAPGPAVAPPRPCQWRGRDAVVSAAAERRAGAEPSRSIPPPWRRGAAAPGNGWEGQAVPAPPPVPAAPARAAARTALPATAPAPPAPPGLPVRF